MTVALVMMIPVDDNDDFGDNDVFGDYQIDWLLLEDEEGRQLRKMSEHLEPLREPLMVFIVFGIFMTVIIIVINICNQILLW